MDLFIYGSGSTGCELVDVAQKINKNQCRWRSIHFVDDIRVEREFYRTKIFRFNEMLAGDTEFECVIAQGEPAHRQSLYEKLTSHSIKLATIVDTSATISSTAKIGNGCIIGPHSFISSNSILQENVMLEIHTIIGHDITIGKHSVISSCSIIGGKTSIGDATFIGMNCTIKERLKIGKQCIIGMHSGVFSDIDDDLIALGNPARVVRKNEDNRVFRK